MKRGDKRHAAVAESYALGSWGALRHPFKLASHNRALVDFLGR